MSRTLNILILLVALFILIMLNMKPKDGGTPVTHLPKMPQKVSTIPSHLNENSNLDARPTKNSSSSREQHPPPTTLQANSAQPQDAEDQEISSGEIPHDITETSKELPKESKKEDEEPLITVELKDTEPLNGTSLTINTSRNEKLDKEKDQPLKEYVVQEGEYLYLIADKFDIPFGELIKANPQIKDPDFVCVGQIIYLPLQK